MPKTDWRARGDPPPSALHPPPDELPNDPADDDRRNRGRRKAGPAQTAAAGKRFIEPFPFTAAEREAIAADLAQAGLGDTTAREIFIGAIAYDLAVLDDALGRRPAPSATAAPEPAMAPEAGPPAADAAQTEPELARQAHALAAALDALDAASRSRLSAALTDGDRYRRDYGGAYFDALTGEIKRLATAATALSCPAAPGAAPPPKPRRKPRAASMPARRSPGDIATGFIRHAAKVYEQCFDAKPTPDGAFARALGSIAATTGIPIPIDPTLLRRALGAD
ncbi:hypothetical protein [Thiohalocapsa sp. ML1]|jgi:hypothetical protein|uniref:hypothetical protein n=1 Tax=Thiohalocapsa sp. ML1 TaxID=1431688 RepID=UPI000731F22C|nr:hypothetical protein [Thiohalocapsa sp. ML1]